MDRIIAKLVRKYFEYLLKNKWMKKIIKIPIDKQKQLIELLHIDVDDVTDEILLSIKSHIEFTESSIETNIETAVDESKEENVWEND